MWTISSVGTVQQAVVQSTTMNNAKVEQCLIAQIQRIRFPKPKGGGIVKVSYPFIFDSTGGGPTPPPTPVKKLSTTEMNTTLTNHRDALQACYTQGLAKNPALTGRVDTQWDITESGTVDNVSITSSSLNDAAVEGCLVNHLKTLQFPALRENVPDEPSPPTVSSLTDLEPTASDDYDPKHINDVVAQNEDDAMGCLINRGLSLDNISLTWHIDADGYAHNAKATIHGGTSADVNAQVADCLTARLTSWRFPPSKTADVTITLAAPSREPTPTITHISTVDEGTSTITVRYPFVFKKP